MSLPSFQLLLCLLQHLPFPPHPCPGVSALLALWSPWPLLLGSGGPSPAQLRLSRPCPSSLLARLLPLWTSLLLSKLSSFSRHTVQNLRVNPPTPLPSQIQPVPKPLGSFFCNICHACGPSLFLSSIPTCPPCTLPGAEWLRAGASGSDAWISCQLQASWLGDF